MAKLIGTPFPGGEDFMEPPQAAINTQHAEARAKETFRLMAGPPVLDCGSGRSRRWVGHACVGRRAWRLSRPCRSRNGVGEFMAQFVNDFLPDLVFEEIGIRCRSEASRFQSLDLLFE